MGKRLVSVLVLICFILTFGVGHAGWVDDWIQQKSTATPGYLEGQQRGYFTGGSFSARWYSGNDYLFSINPPKFKAGCGGIDIFGGGFSFLNFDYLVQKLQRMIQAAPAIAFDIALQVLSQELANSIKSFENIVDKLNNIQLDECKLAKGSVAVLASPLLGDKLPKEYQEARTDLLTSIGQYDFWTGSNAATAANNDRPQENLSQLFEGCGQDIKSIFASTGSVLDHIGQKFGVSSSYVDLMRGFIGDVTLNQDDSSGVYTAHYVSPCDKNKSIDIDNFLMGNAEAKNSSGTCYVITDTNKDLLKMTQQKLVSITQKIKSKASLTSDEQQFINTIPVPILPTLKYGIQARHESLYVGLLSDIVARMYAYMIMSDLYYKVGAIIENAYSLATQQRNAVANKKENTCKIDITGAPEELQQIFDTVHKRLADLKKSYVAYASELNAIQTLVARLEHFDKITYEKMSQVFSPSLVERAIGR